MPERLRPGSYYHLYNRGNGGANLFRRERNYRYFLKKYAYYAEPVAQTFAYALMPNHFHLLVRVKPLAEQPPEQAPLKASRQLAHCFNAYTKAVNRAWGRSGSLFEKNFKRRAVDSERYFAVLVRYIHRNPQAHGFVQDFRTWPHTSYAALGGARPTRLRRALVMEWFGGRSGFRAAHAEAPPPQALRDVVDEAFEAGVEQT
jgi:REP element-mobilizing transposase RayT